HRQRVHRGHRGPVSVVAGVDRAPLVRRHPAAQRRRAPARLACREPQGSAMSDTTLERYRARKITDMGFRVACGAAVLFAVLPLVSVLYFTAVRGLGGINVAFFTQLPKPVGESGGGMGNAIDGTLKLVGMACLLGMPVGVLAGVCL